VARGGIEEAGHGLDVTPAGEWTTPMSVDAPTRALLDLYLPLAVRGDLVIGQMGQSLDGRVATASGHSHYVTGTEDLTRLHRVRALVDAVVVGAGTATSDRPQLTVRRVEGEHPTRVILDPRGRVTPEGPLFEEGTAPTLWIRRGRPGAPLPPHVEVVEAPTTGADGLMPPASILEVLRRRGLRRVLVEGGGATVSAFLAAEALDRLHVTIAPLVIGSGLHGLTLPVVDHLDQALRPPSRHFALGDDVLFDLELDGSRAR
jgi:riboflavin-specific deaminase-like protein